MWVTVHDVCKVPAFAPKVFVVIRKLFTGTELLWCRFSVCLEGISARMKWWFQLYRTAKQNMFLQGIARQAKQAECRLVRKYDVESTHEELHWKYKFTGDNINYWQSYVLMSEKTWNSAELGSSVKMSVLQASILWQCICLSGIISWM